MSAHHCINCPTCRGGCSICGRCACKVKTFQNTFTPTPLNFWQRMSQQIQADIDRDILGFTVGDEEAEPKTD